MKYIIIQYTYTVLFLVNHWFFYFSSKFIIESYFIKIVVESNGPKDNVENEEDSQKSNL